MVHKVMADMDSTEHVQLRIEYNVGGKLTFQNIF